MLVLDEPFSGLDPMGVDAMAAVLRARVDAGAALVFSSHQLDLVERLCDAVGIIRAGRMVADGTVEQLRGTTVPRYRVQVDAGNGWIEKLATEVPGLSTVEADDRTALVELTDGGDDQRLLDAARRLGSVRQFTPVRPSLVELFRDAVTEVSADGSVNAPAGKPAEAEEAV